MRIAIIGAGGVGGYFGGRLAAAGANVTFVARGAHLDAMRRNGLRLISSRGDLLLEEVKAVPSFAEVGDVDLVIVTVKLWDTEAVAHEVATAARRGATVLSFQNGVQKDEVFRRHAPANQVLGGLAYVSASIDEPGVIRQVGPMNGLTFGAYGGAKSACAEALFDVCGRAGIDARISGDIEREIWEKFVFLVGMSATNASMRHPLGPVRSNPQTRAFLLDIMREVVAVARVRRVRIAEDYAENRLAFADTLPADNEASMAHDLHRGHRLELPWLSGCVVDYGRAAGVPTPCNRAVSDILALFVDGRSGS